jgi:hypothetical protein
MISSIGSSLPYYGQSQAQSGTASLSQTEEKLFAQIDSDGNGSISKSELTNFLDKVSGALGGTQPSGAAGSSLSRSTTGVHQLAGRRLLLRRKIS